MEFRWVAGITLWTMLSGPVFIHWAEAVPRPGQAASAPAVRRAPMIPAPSRPARPQPPISYLAATPLPR